MSKAILIALVLGIGAGVVMPENVSGFLDTASSYMLLILLFSVGIDMGVNREVFGQIRRMGLRILVIPLGVILGSLAGGAVCAMILRMDVKEGLAITSGLGWYSLSGILMTEAGNPIGGTISFLSNVFREVLTFLLQLTLLLAVSILIILPMLSILISHRIRKAMFTVSAVPAVPAIPVWQ